MTGQCSSNEKAFILYFPRGSKGSRVPATYALLRKERNHAEQRGCIWLTPKGLKYARLNPRLRYYEPSPSTLPHMYAVNEVRLLIEARCPKDTWRSEREIRAMQNANAKDSTPPHVPDAELISAN